MERIEADAVVVGAGPSGVAAALCLLREGLRVLVIDPGLQPAPRTESLPANGISLAESLGLAPALADAGLGRAAAMRLYWRNSPETRDFGQGGPLLLDRRLFHAALRGLLPASVMFSGRVSRLMARGDRVLVHLGAATISARVVIDARGRAGLRAPRRAESSLAALGFTGLLETAAVHSSMMLQSLAEGWLWACLQPSGRLSGSLFLPVSSLAGLDAGKRARLLARQLEASVLGVPLDLSAGPVTEAMLRAADDAFAGPLMIRVGDAALARDPVSSHGLVHALRSSAQAAAAAVTLLDPDGDDTAARSFIRERHRHAVTAATEATALVHAERSWRQTAFWQSAEATSPSAPAAVQWPTLSRPLALAPLRRAAVLERGRIRWDDAVWLSRSRRAAPRFGDITARRLAQLLAPPAPLTLLSARLEKELKPGVARGILQQLLDEGALFEAASAVSQTAATASRV